MSSFSPYMYDISKFKQLKKLDNYSINSSYDMFTFLSKPKRNVYKISLSHLLHNLVEFGIGYGSVCVTTITTQQIIRYGRYVNRHNTNSPLRPATVADLKEKIKTIVYEMIKHTIKYKKSASVETNEGVKQSNNFYPTHLFTLDKNLTTEKLKKITNVTYKEDENFKDFAYSIGNSTAIAFPDHEDGYIPVEDGLYMCKNHKHDLSGQSIGYAWYAKVRATSHEIIRKLHGGTIPVLLEQDVGEWAQGLGHPYGTTGTLGPSTSVSANATINWEYPEGMECYESDKVDPAGAKMIDDVYRIPVRYHGRRYRLFKLSS